MHQHEALLVREVKVMRDSGVGFRERSMQLVRGEVCEDDSGRVGVGGLRWSSRWRRRGRRVESPLEEMDIGTANGRLDRLAIFTRYLLRLLSGKREDELRVLASGLGDTSVRFQRNTGTDRVRVIGITQSPERFDFLVRQREDLFNV